MRILERIWADIRRGENIELYAVVVIAFGIVVLDLIGVAPPSLIAPLTLAVLGLLAVSTLGSRHRIEQLVESLDQSAKTVFLHEFPPSLHSDFVSATEIWVVGVSLYTTMGDYYAEMERGLQAGKTIKILVVDPENGPAVEMAASRAYVRLDPDVLSRRIVDSLQYAHILKQIAPDRLEIRTIQNPLTLGMTAMNPDSASGILYLKHYPFRTEGGSLPKFVIRATDGPWYDFFKKEMRALWDSGTEWKGSNSSPKDTPSETGTSSGLP